MTAVIKFGGSSVKSVARIQHVAQIVKRTNPGRCVVVVSAMGDTTDHLLALAKQCAGDPCPRELDMLLATGEQVSIALVALTLREAGVRARSYTGGQLRILTDDDHASAQILDIDRQAILESLEDNEVIVVAGFQGITASGAITTLGRGGSDTSAVALAAAIGARECDIYTDVDGVFSADPREVSAARLLPELSFHEVLEFAHAGAQVIHPRAVQLASDHGITLRVRNTFKPEHSGTTIKGEEKVERLFKVSGVATDRQLALITFDLCENTSPGLHQIAELLQRQQICVESIVPAAGSNLLGRRSVCVQVKYADADIFLQSIERLGDKLPLVSRINLDVAKVSLIGRGFARNKTLVAEIVAVLAEQSVEVAQLTASDIRITCLVSSAAAACCTAVLHERFIQRPAPCLAKGA